MQKRDRNRGDELLIGALAAGSPVEQAAETAGVSVRTAYRRLADPVFARRLAQARDELISSALGELVDCASEAVATLRALLSANDERVRLGAAKSTLDQLLRLRETLDAQPTASRTRALPASTNTERPMSRLQTRLDRLEQQLPRCRECTERRVQVELVSPQEAKGARARPDPICPGCGEPSERILVLLSFDPQAEAAR